MVFITILSGVKPTSQVLWGRWCLRRGDVSHLYPPWLGGSPRDVSIVTVLLVDKHTCRDGVGRTPRARYGEKGLQVCDEQTSLLRCHLPTASEVPVSFCYINKIYQISWISINIFVSGPKAKLFRGTKIGYDRFLFFCPKSGRKGEKGNKEQMGQSIN